MSNITLYYFPQINSVDTPVFDTEAHQRSFYNSLTKYVVPDEAFYVPKFKDVIVLSIDDLNFSSNYNYLSLLFRNKYYYYFISSYEYLSETEISAEIEMDVIQTYMFNVRIVRGELVRNSIKRWIDDTHINRNYIRENLSDGTFVQASKRTYTGETLLTRFSQKPFSDMVLPEDNFRNVIYRNRITGFIVIKASDTFTSAGSSPYPAVVDTKLNVSSSKIYHGISSCRYGLIPLVDGRVPGEQKVLMLYTSGGNTTVQWVQVNFRKALSDSIAKKTQVQSIYYVPMQCFDENLIASYSCDYKTSDSETFDSGVPIIVRRTILDVVENCIVFIDSDTTLLREKIVELPVGFYKDTFTLGLFQPNDNKAAPFQFYYVPFLMDENYYRISFGSPTEQCTIPLFNVDIDSFTVEFYSDILSGFKYYNIVPSSVIEQYDGSPYMYDVNNSISVDKNVSYLDTLSDAWRNYYDYNKGSFYGAIASTAISSISSFAIAGTTVSRANTGMRSIINDPKSYDKRYKAPVLRKKAERSLRQYYESGLGAVRGAEFGISSLLSNLSSAKNAMFAPTTLRTAGFFSSDDLVSNNVPSIVISHVQDYIECAKYVEENGYKVYELVSGNLQSFNNRYYYDVVVFGTVSVALTGVIQDLETIDLITERLQQGLRLWHTTDGELNTNKVSGITLEMGQVCKYDNVEV